MKVGEKRIFSAAGKNHRDTNLSFERFVEECKSVHELTQFHFCLGD